MRQTIYHGEEPSHSSRAEKFLALLFFAMVIVSFAILVMIIKDVMAEVQVFNYTETLGDLNITMYYDEPKMTEQEWEELEEKDEEEHEEWAEENDLVLGEDRERDYRGYPDDDGHSRR